MVTHSCVVVCLCVLHVLGVITVRYVFRDGLALGPGVLAFINQPRDE